MAEASSTSPLQNAEQRRRAVTWALRLAKHSALAPGKYERRLLAQFIRGDLTLEQVLQRLE
ncbi:hypothetical protein [Hymenobacter latericus]|uniref:hypothetical protein n=1 Tax=Hymenobacter sp. YIM 151858-1 TaxID=2987688 RepID=UPI00222760CD|nr:hypothetical protein [Hymenobacter sp. YIM 151858-1]UYZ59819.1 hypothetical protein OIS50_03255 [Hymenobacter sp. YIM 151858-1]